MPMLAELIAREWSEAKSALESSVRSGSRTGTGVDVDTVLDRIAGLVRSVGRQELQDVLSDSGLGSHPHLVTGDFEPGGDPARTTAFAGSRSLDQTTDHRAAPDDTARNPTDLPAANAADPTATVDQTGAYSSGDQDFEVGSPRQSPADTEPTNPARRKIPTVPGYEIAGVLGRGGMGVVYRAVQVGLRRTVALKMILAGEHASGVQLKRFAAEARAVALVRHPGIVQIYEIGEHEGLPYFSLEFCPGGSLDRKSRYEPQPPRAAATVAEQLARALAAAHAAGVVHRDIKPANVLLDADGLPKITDFGLARELDAADANTRTGSIIGTPSYMSPEQAEGLPDIGPASDQYSLGATLYELLTGRPPFQGTSVVETLDQVRRREPVPPGQHIPSCPPDLETICLKALQKEPAKRYESCQAFADDLHAYLDGRPIAARPVGRVEKAWRWAKRNPRTAGLSAAVAALLVALATGGAAAAVIFDDKKRQAEGLAEDRRIAREFADLKTAEAEKALAEKDAALQSETKALQASDQSYGLTRETVFTALDEIPAALAQAVFARGAEQQVLEALGTMLEKQLGLALTRGLPDRAVMNFQLKMGDLMARRGKAPEAEKRYRTALEITARLLRDEPTEKDKAKGNHALILRKLGNLARDTRRDGAADALKFYAEAVALQRAVLDKPLTHEIPPAEAKAALAGTLFDQADLYRRAALFDRALPPCEEALKLWAEALKLPATAYTANAGPGAAEAYVLLGKIQGRRGRDDEAETALAESVRRYRDLLKAGPTNVTLMGLTARAAREYGDFLLMRGKFAAAAPPHELDLHLTRSLFLIPEIVAAQAELADVYYRSATLALKTGDRPAADKLYRKCLELRLAVAEGRPNDVRQPIRVANAQARCGLHVEAFAAMESLAAKFPNDPFVVRQAAFNIAICVDSVAAGKSDDKLTAPEKELCDKYSDRALALIEDLTGRLNFTDVVQLKTDPDLDAIRSTPRFQAVVKKLGKRQQ